MKSIKANIRKENNRKMKIKGIIYGKNIKNNIKIEINDKSNYYNEIQENKIIKVKILNKNYNLIIKNISKHPFKKKIIHIDFFLNE